MRALLKQDRAVIIPDEGTEHEACESQLASWSNQGFRGFRSGGALVFEPVGPYDEVFRVPINVTSMNPDPKIQLISNFAETPFEVDCEAYASVEGFWQSLKATDHADRRRIAALSGIAARNAGRELAAPTTISFRGQPVVWGAPESWDVMRVACRAKFTQSTEACEALLSTGSRPLEHRTRHDSRSIPGVIMAGIWVQLRDELTLLQRRDRHRAEGS
jgi:predicted NAD-dependent protein-ADP-ribosyltransferase YbiA (DUF1768 family)